MTKQQKYQELMAKAEGKFTESDVVIGVLLLNSSPNKDRWYKINEMALSQSEKKMIRIYIL